MPRGMSGVVKGQKAKRPKGRKSSEKKNDEKMEVKKNGGGFKNIDRHSKSPIGVLGFTNMRTPTWKERIMDATTGRNERGTPLWYTHAQICAVVSERQGWDVRTRHNSLSPHCLSLVKTGHLERAIMPHNLSGRVRYNGKPEYLYRQTGKPYTRPNGCFMSHDNAKGYDGKTFIQGFELRRAYPMLPKWFRKMMLD